MCFSEVQVAVSVSSLSAYVKDGDLFGQIRIQFGCFGFGLFVIFPVWIFLPWKFQVTATVILLLVVKRTPQ